jgi:1-acyl-sn-glycerol-3-phosphate acyltransferase
VLAGNHNSNLDALAIMSLLRLHLLPKIRPVAAMDYFLTGGIRSWFASNIIGIIPVKRGSGKEGGNPLQLAKEARDRGEILVIFREGSRGEPETLQEFKKGIGHLAHARPNVPVIPVFMHGLGKALPRGSLVLVLVPQRNRQHRRAALRHGHLFGIRVEAAARDRRSRRSGEIAGVGIG